MRYGEVSWHWPYGGAEGIGYGLGDRTVSGELDGAVVWANYPRRREDGSTTGAAEHRPSPERSGAGVEPTQRRVAPPHRF